MGQGWEEKGTGGEWNVIELPARSSETHTKETLNSSWHLFRSCSWKAADREASSPESVRMLSDIQRVSFSYRRCKEPAEINGQIEFPQLTLCLLASFTSSLPMSLNHYCATVLSPQTVWIHSPHAIFIPLLSLTLNFLSQQLRICYHPLCSIWYLWAHLLHHLVAILYCVKHTDITHKRVFHSYFVKIRASRQVSLFLPPGFLKHLFVLTGTWHLFIQQSFHHPFTLQIFTEQVHQAWHGNYSPCFNHNIVLHGNRQHLHISDFLL